MLSWGIYTLKKNKIDQLIIAGQSCFLFILLCDNYFNIKFIYNINPLSSRSYLLILTFMLIAVPAVFVP